MATTLFAALFASLASSSHAQAQANGKRVLFVTDFWWAGEILMIDRLVQQGFNVDVQPGLFISPLTNVSAYDMVVLSGAAYSGPWAASIISAGNRPTLIGQPTDWTVAYQFGLTTIPDVMACNWSSFMDVIDNNHAVSNPFSGREYFYDGASLVCGVETNFLSRGVRPLINSETWPVVNFPAVIVDSSRKIVASGIWEATSFSADGWRLFDSEVCYLTGVCPKECVSFDPATEYATARQVLWSESGMKQPPAPVATSSYTLTPASVLPTAAPIAEPIYMSCDSSGGDCQGFTAALKSGGTPTAYCTESIVRIGSSEDCCGGPTRDVFDRTYTPTTESGATTLGCSAAPTVLPEAECQQLNLALTGTASCTQLPAVAVVSTSGNADYNQCIAEGQSRAFCAQASQQCFTTQLCSDDPQEKCSDCTDVRDPTADAIAFSSTTEDAKYTMQQTDPEDDLATPTVRQVYACDLADLQAKQRTGGLRASQNSKHMKYKKGSKKWSAGFDAHYVANNGFQQGPFSEGGNNGLNLEAKGTFSITLFGRAMDILTVTGNADASICGVGGTFDFKMFGEFVAPGLKPKRKNFPSASLRNACTDALARVKSAQDSMNKALWSYRTISEYWNTYADTTTGVAVLPAYAAFSGTLPELEFDAQDLKTAYDTFIAARTTYGTRASALDSAIRALQSSAVEFNIPVLGAHETAASPEVQQSIPFGPFSFTLAGQASGTLAGDVDAVGSISLKTAPGMRLPAVEPAMNLEFTPSADAGGWVFAGVGVGGRRIGAAIGIRGNLTLIDVSMPLNFGVNLIARTDAQARTVEYRLGMNRNARVEVTLLSGSIDAEARAWIKLWRRKLQRAYRKNLTEWPGIFKPIPLDDRKPVDLGTLFTVPFFLSGLDALQLDVLPKAPNRSLGNFLATHMPSRSNAAQATAPYRVDREQQALAIRSIFNLGQQAWSATNPDGDADKRGICQLPKLENI